MLIPQHWGSFNREASTEVQEKCFGIMHGVVLQAQADEGIRVDQIPHGNSASISRTHSLVILAAPGPRLITGIPVTLLILILGLRFALPRGMSTM
jgi:hypothetical protein